MASRYDIAKGKPEPPAVPKSLDEAVHSLIELLKWVFSDPAYTPLEEWTRMDEEEALLTANRELGRGLRNGWGLWDTESSLRKDMERIGFIHPDDMSSAIILCAHRTLNGKPLGIEEQVAYYTKYWTVIGTKTRHD